MRSIGGRAGFHNAKKKVALARRENYAPVSQFTNMKPLTRRKFIAATAAAAALPGQALGRKPKQEIIDLHQHTNYSGRNDERMLGHQRALGVKWTVLLPAGRLYGLAANCGGNKSVRRIAVKNPRNYVHFANEIADHPECIATIESFLKKGAVGIGEQKFKVECDSKHIQRIAELAQEYDVPVLMHFEHGNYNTGTSYSRASSAMRWMCFESHSTRNFCSPIPTAPFFKYVSIVLMHSGWSAISLAKWM